MTDSLAPEIRTRPSTREEFDIAILCALKIEAEAVEALFDEKWDETDYGKAAGDQNSYVTGRIDKHDVVLTFMPGMGKSKAASVAASLRSSFTNVKLALVVGICGVPPYTSEGKEILLGDVIISTGVIQYDLGRRTRQGIVRKKTVRSSLGRQNNELSSFSNMLQTSAGRKKLREEHHRHLQDLLQESDYKHMRYPGPHQDKLFQPDYYHKHQDPSACDVCAKCKTDEDEACEPSMSQSCLLTGCDIGKTVRRTRLMDDRLSPPNGTLADLTEEQKPDIHFGQFASGDQVVRSSKYRDKLAHEEGVIAFEMEGSGVWDQFPTIIVKSACDYADCHKNKDWQAFAAASSACCVKSVLKRRSPFERTGPVQASARSVVNGEVHLKTSNWTVPFLRDSHFVERGDILDRVSQKLDTAGARVALVGLGGVGKSQLAIEYSFRACEKVPKTSVFWIFASSRARFEESFKNIALKIGMDGRDDQKSTVRDVSNWLSDEKNGPWLLIVDNADDRAVFRPHEEEAAGLSAEHYEAQHKARMLLESIPQKPHGKVLITSRDRNAAYELVGRHENILQVDPMDNEQAILLFDNKLLPNIDKEGVAELVATLENMPMAISQAAAYINERSPRSSVKKYLDMLNKSESSTLERLRTSSPDLRRDKEISDDSIINTWHISFSQIRAERPTATDLLSMMSLLHRQGIPESLLRHRYTQASQLGIKEQTSKISLLSKSSRLSLASIRSKDGGSISSNRKNNRSYDSGMTASEADFDDPEVEEIETDEDEESIRQDEEFEEDIDTLRRYSLIETNQDGDMFQMHRLVQLSTRAWLKLHDKLGIWRGNCARVMGHAFPTGRYDRWDDCRTLLPHVESLFTQRPAGDSLKPWSLFLTSAARFQTEIGDYLLAEQMADTALTVRKGLFGDNDPLTLDSMTVLVEALIQNSKLERAEELAMHAYRAFKLQFGPHHRDTINSKVALGTVYKHQGKMEEAELAVKKALRWSEQALDPHDEVHVRAINTLGSFLVTGYKPKSPQQVAGQVFEYVEKELGQYNMQLFAKLGNASWLPKKDATYKQAETIFRDALKKREQDGSSGSTPDPSMLRTNLLLAAAVARQGRLGEAQEIYARAVEDAEHALGADNPDTLSAVSGLANVLHDQGNYDEADALYDRACAGFEAKLGVQHETTRACEKDRTACAARRERDAPLLNVEQTQTMRQSMTNNFTRLRLTMQERHDQRMAGNSWLFRTVSEQGKRAKS